ncbi:MAG TPA: hypothetical protein VK184_17170 [Nostocaceae cyanobacterium]|nr:hypothetical protein [Nostocaceae cyanobacterium]
MGNNFQPLEFITTKVQAVVTDSQNLANQAIAKTQETATQALNLAQNAPSSLASAGVIATQEFWKIANNIQFTNLPSNLQLKFARAGMRGRLRDIQAAAEVFETIPAQVRAQGPDAVREFCHNKDWSHIIARVNGGSNEASNGIFEYYWINRARGGVNMTQEELATAREVLADAAFKAAVTEIIAGVMKGVLVSAAVELVFSILENSLLFAEGKIKREEFIKKVSFETAQAGLAGGVITGILLTICMIFPPIAAILGAVAIPLAVVGIGAMTIRSWEIFCHANRLFKITENTQKLLGMSAETVV